MQPDTNVPGTNAPSSVNIDNHPNISLTSRGYMFTLSNANIFGQSGSVGGGASKESAGLEQVLKERHLTRSERSVYHQPRPDWKESSRGDVCKNASTLEVEDIITKYKK